MGGLFVGFDPVCSGVQDVLGGIVPLRWVRVFQSLFQKLRQLGIDRRGQDRGVRLGKRDYRNRLTGRQVLICKEL